MNSRGHDDDALWSAYLDGTLDAETRARAEARLRASAADREALEAMRAAEAQLRAMPVPDPGAAYWRDFGARVEARMQPRDPARIYEKLVAWFVSGDRVRWMRAAGALAGLTLVTYVGMRGFRPAEVRMREALPVEIKSSPPPQIAPPKEDSPGEAPPATTHRDASREIAEGQTKTRDLGASRSAAPKPRADQDDAASRSEAEVSQPQALPPPAPQPPAPQATYKVVPKDKAKAEESTQHLKSAPRTFAIEPQAQREQDGVGKLTLDREALSVDARGGRGLSATDSIASFLAQSLRIDSSLSNISPTGRLEFKALTDSKRASKATIPPSPAPRSAAEVDRLLQLADIAEHHATDPAIRPYLETIAMRLAESARDDPRAAARARTLMRNLAASSNSPSDRALWEERLRQLPN